MKPERLPVIPAKSRNPGSNSSLYLWIPAFAGMTPKARHFPNFLVLSSDATPPGRKMSAPTKIMNRPTGAHPIPM